VGTYRDLAREADAEASSGRYKQAYNVLGRAPWRGAPEDQDARYRRGRYAYEVAHQRLDEFRDSPSPKQTLIKAGCWLARAEAYLSSAAEGVDDDARRDQVEDDIRRTKQEQERFRRLCDEFGENLFLTGTEKLNDD
jgi:hypothetical protein